MYLRATCDFFFHFFLYQIEKILKLRCLSGNSNQTAKRPVDDVFRTLYKNSIENYSTFFDFNVTKFNFLD